MGQRGHPSLTEQQVRDYRKRYRHRFAGVYNGKPNITQVQIAQELGITQVSVSNMLNGRTYRWVK